jgi:hypothetical protein
MPYSGKEVVSKHKSAVSRCRGKGGWDALECIVDEMQKEYPKT